MTRKSKKESAQRERSHARRARLAGHPVLRFFFGAPVGDERLERRRSERARLRTARVLSLWQGSRLRGLAHSVRGIFFMTTPRAIAFFLLPLALATAFRCLLLPMLTDDFPLLITDGVAGAVLLLLSLPMLAVGDPVHTALNERRFLSYLLFDTLALPRPYATKQRGVPAWLMLFPGLLLGALSLATSPLHLILLLLGLGFFMLTLASPDFSLLLTGILLPLSALLPQPTVVLAFALLLTAVAYAVKLLLGKRLFRFEAIDLLVLLFSLALLLSGLFSSAERGLSTALSAAALVLLGYFLTANLLSTRRTVTLMARGMLFIATLLAALGVFRGVVSLIDPALSSQGFISTLTGIAGRIFESQATMASYLLLLFPLLFSVLSDTARLRWRYIPTLLLLPAALGLTLNPVVYLTLVLSLLLFALFNMRARPRGFLLAFAVLPCFLFLLPTEAVRWIADLFSFLGIEEDVLSRLTAMQVGARALVGELGHPLGIGPGHTELSLRAFFASYGCAGVDGGSLYLTMGIQLGAVGLLTFILLLAFAVRDSLRTLQISEDNRYRTVAVGIVCSIFSALLLAPYENIFANHRVLLLFFMLVGLATAVRRAALYEDTVIRQTTNTAESTGGNVSLRLGKGGAGGA